MKTLLLAVLLGLLGMVVALAGDPTPPAIKLVPIATSVAKKSVVVAPAMPRLEIRAGEPGTVWVRVYGPPGKYTLLWNCQPFGWQELVSNFQMPPQGAEGSFPTSFPGSVGAGFFGLRLETTEFSGN